MIGGRAGVGRSGSRCQLEAYMTVCTRHGGGIKRRVKMGLVVYQAAQGGRLGRGNDDPDDAIGITRELDVDIAQILRMKR